MPIRPSRIMSDPSTHDISLPVIIFQTGINKHSFLTNNLPFHSTHLLQIRCFDNCWFQTSLTIHHVNFLQISLTLLIRTDNYDPGTFFVFLVRCFENMALVTLLKFTFERNIQTHTHTHIHYINKFQRPLMYIIPARLYVQVNPLFRK